MRSDGFGMPALPGVVGFRDFGGVSSRYGGHVSRDRLYRSGTPNSATQASVEHLLGLDFGLIADLRFAGERAEEPSPWPSHYEARTLFHHGSEQEEPPHIAPLRNGTMDEATAERIYIQFYRDLPFDPLYRPLFARVLNALPDQDGRVLIHCSAGKDRTGALVALIQHALGATHDEIVTEFMKSRHVPELRAMAEPYARRMEQRFGRPARIELMKKLLDVEEDYLASLMVEIENRCGSVDAYLDAAGLNAARRERLRARFLTG